MEEYYKIAAFVQAYDSYSVAIKTWGVTVTGAAIAVGFSGGVAASPGMQIVVFVIAFALALTFWFSETIFKMLQHAHTRRIQALEAAFSSGSELAGPAYLSSFMDAQAFDRKYRVWYGVFITPATALPHLIFLLASVGLIVFAVIRATQ